MFCPSTHFIRLCIECFLWKSTWCTKVMCLRMINFPVLLGVPDREMSAAFLELLFHQHSCHQHIIHEHCTRNKNGQHPTCVSDLPAILFWHYFTRTMFNQLFPILLLLKVGGNPIAEMLYLLTHVLLKMCVSLCLIPASRLTLLMDIKLHQAHFPPALKFAHIKRNHGFPDYWQTLLVSVSAAISTFSLQEQEIVLCTVDEMTRQWHVIGENNYTCHVQLHTCNSCKSRHSFASLCCTPGADAQSTGRVK